LQHKKIRGEHAVVAENFCAAPFELRPPSIPGGAANRNFHWFSRRTFCLRVAMAVENAARFDHHTGAMNVSVHEAFGMNLHARSCAESTLKSAQDHHRIPVDGPFDASMFTENQQFFRLDVSPDLRIDPKCAGQSKFTFGAHALLHESSPGFIFLSNAI
jgi:hypothetical protein